MYKKITSPTIVIHCRSDQIVLSEEGRHLASVVPGARLALIPGQTHYFPTESEIVPKVVAKIIGFLESTGAGV